METFQAKEQKDSVKDNQCSMEGENDVKFGLRRDQVLPQFREPFILSGYRRPYINAKDCLQSAFIPHCNESFNVWSHFMAFVLFVVKFYYNFRGEHSLRNSFAWPEFSYAIGICGFCLMSATAHVFNSISTRIRQICFYMDYAAISIYSVGAGQAFYFYSRPLDNTLPLITTVERFTLASLLTSVISTWICCRSRNRRSKTKYLARTLAYCLPFFVNSYPYLYRAFFLADGSDAVTGSLPLFRQHCYLYLLSGLANMTRFPECFFPGKFDLIGASHHYLHIFTGIGAMYQFDAIHTDMLIRKDKLLSLHPKPDAWNTLLPMTLGILANVGISTAYSYYAEDERSKKKE